ncbi:MAG: cytochrome P450 [Actinobacteria bacterium]|nr:cytochrome P450 [Actinomycetota bacterium]
MSQLPLDLHSSEFLEDPAPTLGWLREHDPVHRSPYGYWLLTRYDDITAALRDPRLSSEWTKKGSLPGVSARHREAPDLDDPFVRAQRVVLHSFNMKDPPSHTRIRQLVQQAFTRAAVDEQRGRVLELVDAYLAAGLRAGELDLVTELAFPLTITVASEMIGIPADARAEFRASFEDTERLGDPTATDAQRDAAKAALVWQLDFIASVVEARRSDPRDDLVTALVQAEADGEVLTHDEILAALLTLYTAAGTTTERMISSGMLLLLRHPEQWAQVRAQPQLVNGAVTEILRYHHPNQQTTTPRLALDDIELRGQVIPAGSTVRVALGAANRDPARWDRPERFDITRQELVSLGFGQGIHYCIGAPLARMQAEQAISRLAALPRPLVLDDHDIRHDPRRMDRYERIRVTFPD